jgi:hypothetical protein
MSWEWGIRETHVMCFSEWPRIRLANHQLSLAGQGSKFTAGVAMASVDSSNSFFGLGGKIII